MKFRPVKASNKSKSSGGNFLKLLSGREGLWRELLSVFLDRKYSILFSDASLTTRDRAWILRNCRSVSLSFIEKNDFILAERTLTLRVDVG